MNEDKVKVKSSTVWKALGLVGIIIVIAVFVLPTLGFDDSYTGEYILANKVFLNDGGINIVIYFNESSDSTHYLIFEDWDASHSVTLANLDAGENIKVSYKDYVFGVRTIVDIEIV